MINQHIISMLLYGLETVALAKRQEVEMVVAELKMLRFSLAVTRMGKIGNEYIRGTARVGWFGEKTQEAFKKIKTKVYDYTYVVICFA